MKLCLDFSLHPISLVRAALNAVFSLRNCTADLLGSALGRELKAASCSVSEPSRNELSPVLFCR